ncbi:MAG: hypothetical protein QOD53_2322 [Thermoleophilaceae bacterium]|nr:hypothetical protein [Thermoleophilaceae bacterium]
MTPTPGGRALAFGVYPGGVAGQIVVPATPKPDDDARVLAALGQLRPAGGPFTVHIYRSYLNDAQDAKEDAEHRRLVELYTSRGYGVEIVLRYRRDGDPAGFAKFVRGVVDRFGDNPLVRGFQVANEVNFAASGDSSDGVYAGARDALIAGVIAAKDEARKRGYGQLRIGFNWFYRTDPNSEDGFWQYLHDHGGKPFVAALDWVGLDVYPGTFFPPATAPAMTGDFVVNALSQLRGCFMPEAGIPKTVPIHVEENGYPTGPGRSEDDQRTALESMVGVANTYRANYNVSNYFWFDLRDADSSSPNFQQQYGLMHDDYTPKGAFGSFRSLVSKLSVREAPPPGVNVNGGGTGGSTLLLRVRCYRRGVLARLEGDALGDVRRVVFRARHRRARDAKAPFKRHIRLRRTHRRHRVRVVARVKLGSRGVALKRSVRCRPR